MYSCLPESVLGFANADTVILPRWRKHRECRSCSCDTYVLRKRYILTQNSRAFDLKGPLYEDFFFYLDKFLIKGVDIQFRLFRSKNEFVLMSKEASATYKVNILDAVFKACKVKVDSAILGNHTNAILKSPARHSYLKTDVKMTTQLSDKTSEFYWGDV